MPARPGGRFLLGGILIAVVLTGCGGEDRLTRAEFVEQADAICAADEAAIDELDADLTVDSPEREINAAIDAYVVVVREQVRELADLEPPAALEKDVEAMLESLEEGLAEMADDGAASIKAGANPLADAARRARELGLEECGS